jgi:ferritin-like metal-binding protein YciE
MTINILQLKIFIMKSNEDMKNLSHQLRALWSIENRLIQKMPAMIEKANHFGLKKNLSLHFEETRQHKTAIQLICKQLQIDISNTDLDKQLEDILQEGERSMEGKQGTDLDAAIIRTGQEVEQYEISLYAEVAQMAQATGYKGVAGRLWLTQQEEKQADNKLKFVEGVLLKETADIGQSMPQYH